MTNRRYEQRLRAESAEETRRRILDAVYECLHAAPTQPLSLEQVARTARVARSTIYLIFGSRAGLFDAIAIDVLYRGGFEKVTEAVAHPDAREHLRRGVRAGMEMYAAYRDVHRVMFSTAALDPEAMTGAMRRADAGRAGGTEYMAKRLAEQGQLRQDVTEADAANILFLATSFDAFDVLYTGRGLPVDEVARLMVDTAERAVCRPADPTE
jgi:AcrR family transcriptional regulator